MDVESIPDAALCFAEGGGTNVGAQAETSSL